jgi:hypothetical protein
MDRRTSLLKFLKIFYLITVLSLAFNPETARSQVDRFIPLGQSTEVWRITQDPTVRDWANYHNTQCWSSDGRYICFTHFASNGTEFGTREAAEVHIYDLHEDKDILVDKGTNPRWANDHNWLFYTRLLPENGPSHNKGTEVMWLDVPTGKLTRLAYGVQRLRETDTDDRWLYGIRSIDREKRNAVRIQINENASLEFLPGDGDNQFSSKLTVNPQHPVIVFRDHNYPDYNFSSEETGEIPFIARYHTKTDLDGNNKIDSFPIMEGAHFSWSGDGTYFLCGNGIMRGIRWDEFLPGNIHFLAPIRCGDICKCGKSGRWICGSTKSGRGPLAMADLRSGDGWIVMKTHSVICYPGSEDNSGPYDIDAKGSPDATKIVFVSNYDLKNGPYAVISENVTTDKITVNSTEGFPEKGRLVAVTGFHREVLSYDSKTATSFTNLSRGLYGTPVSSPEKDQVITLFESRLIPEEKWESLPLPSGSIRRIIKDMDSPLMRQRSSDIYTVITRKPDSPYLRETEGGVELIPGENHWETCGYELYKDGAKMQDALIKPGESFKLSHPGEYAAIAVEWSGLKSKRSQPLQVGGNKNLIILQDKPLDFNWTYDKWFVDEKEVSAAKSKLAAESVKEIIHLYDGVIHREWYSMGQINKRVDLNVEGKPTRQLFYENGKLARRELHHRDGRHVSTEYFDPQGYITESIHKRLGSGRSYGYTRWWYEKGVPVKAEKGGELYNKEGSKWVKK